ncbi:MAG: DUF1064 domain-containing protein [Oscillospiraceae bacterium]|jgi:hypothetical protein
MSTRFIPDFDPPSGTIRKPTRPRQGRPNKYRNRKTVVDGITFDSKAEARRYCELKNLKAMQKIAWFNRQPSFLLPGGIRYRPDFIICAGGRIWVEDVKGMETKEFKLKRKLWNETYPGLPLKIVK